MQHVLHLGPRGQPVRHGESLALGLAQAQLQRAQTAQRQENILRSRAHGEEVERLAQPRPPGGIGGDEAEQEVGMAGEIFRSRLDGEIDAAFMRRKEQRRRPGIVHDDADAAGMRGSGDRRHVLHFETLRPRRLDEDGIGVRPQQPFDRRADRRVVIGRLDAEALQELVAEEPGRTIGRVGDQEMTAAPRRGHQRERDRGKPRGGEHRAGGAGDFAPGEFECLGGRRPLGAVREAMVVLLERASDNRAPAPSIRDKSAY